MIIKTIFKIEIHFLYYLVAAVAVFTGFFKDFLIFTSIIFIHEIGHVLVALYYKWNIAKILILPFGGLTIFNEQINKSLKEELHILIGGPLLQTSFFILMYNITNNYVFYNYHFFILLFNLLPIFPLDGSKLLNIILNKIIPFKISYIITLVISIIIIFFITIFIFNNNFLIIITFLFLLIKVIIEFFKISYIFNKFLFERYIYPFSFKKTKIIKGDKLYKMFKEKKHLFCIDNTYVSEKKVLDKRFGHKNYL